MASMIVIVYPNHGNHMVVCSTTSEDFLKMVNLGGTNPQKARPLLGPDVGPVLEDVSAVLPCPNSLLRLSSVCDGQTPTWTPTPGPARSRSWKSQAQSLSTPRPPPAPPCLHTLVCKMQRLERDGRYGPYCKSNFPNHRFPTFLKNKAS